MKAQKKCCTIKTVAGRYVASAIAILLGFSVTLMSQGIYASATGEGVSCEIPENADKIKEIYQNKSATILTNWELESVDVGCGGSISASYILPQFSDNDATFIVYLQQNQPLQQLRGEEDNPFPADFIEQRDVSVAESISTIMSNYVFKAIKKEFTNKTISFVYGTHSYFYISGYKEFETCKSNFEVDVVHPELLFFSISNDADIERIPLIKAAREYAKVQLQNASNAVAMKIKNVSDISCGQTTVYTSYSIDNRGIEPYSYTATVDIECYLTNIQNNSSDKSCPDEVKIVFGTDIQSPIMSNITSGSAGNKDVGTVLQQQATDFPDRKGEMYNTFVPIGIAASIAGVIAFVTLTRGLDAIKDLVKKVKRDRSLN